MSVTGVLPETRRQERRPWRGRRGRRRAFRLAVAERRIARAGGRKLAAAVALAWRALPGAERRVILRYLRSRDQDGRSLPIAFMPAPADSWLVAPDALGAYHIDDEDVVVVVRADLVAALPIEALARVVRHELGHLGQAASGSTLAGAASERDAERGLPPLAPEWLRVIDEAQARLISGLA